MQEPRRDGVSASGGGPAAQLARQVRLPSAAASAASAAPVVSAASPAGPWIRAAVTGVVLGALAFLLFLGVRGRTPAGPSQGGPRASLSSGESR